MGRRKLSGGKEQCGEWVGKGKECAGKGEECAGKGEECGDGDGEECVDGDGENREECGEMGWGGWGGRGWEVARRASCRIRTNDPEITNHVLWPTELKRLIATSTGLTLLSLTHFL